MPLIEVRCTRPPETAFDELVRALAFTRRGMGLTCSQTDKTNVIADASNDKICPIAAIA
jgi:hypothetical protein